MLVEKKTLQINDTTVPVVVYRERRNGVRFAIVKDGVVNMRIPILFTMAQEAEQYERLETWLKKVFKRKAAIVNRFEKRNYQNGDILTVGRKQYRIEINYENRKSHTAKLINGTMFFKLAESTTIEAQQKAIRQLMSRLVADDFLPEITRRVYELNQLHFRKAVKSVSFKYNHSNWGSCSRTGNINFSTRLLFAPDEVIDYVIIHELSHLIEMNHSDRFWKVVASAMPDYAAKEKWLSQNSALCDF